MFNYFFVCMLFIIYPTFTPCEIKLQSDQDDFYYSIIKTEKPSLAEFYRMSGHSDETEIEVEIYYCKKNPSSELCKPSAGALGCRRYNCIESTPSIFLLWLKKQFPEDPIIRVKHIQSTISTECQDHEIITATFDKTEVVFFRALESRGTFGTIIPIEINGRKVLDMFHSDLNTGKLDGLIKENIHDWVLLYYALPYVRSETMIQQLKALRQKID